MTASSPANDPSSVTLTLIGGPTVVIDYAGLRIVTDPTFDEPSLYGPDKTGYAITLIKTTDSALKPADLGAVDVVLASHDHWDNLDDSGRLFAASVPHVFTTDVVAGKISGAVILPEGDSRVVTATDGREVTITAVPAHHGPEGVWQRMGPVIGFVLESPGHKTIYVSGDNADVDVVRVIASKFPEIAIAVLFAGGAAFGALGGAYITLSDESAVEVAKILNKAIIIPVHADSWEHFSQTTASMKQLADSEGVGDRVVALVPGESVHI